MEPDGRETSERRVSETLEEAYELRDAPARPEERGFYQEHVYRLRGRNSCGCKVLVRPNGRRLGGIARWQLWVTQGLLPKSRSTKSRNF